MTRGRRVAVTALIVLASLIGLVSLFATWADRQLLDTQEWTATSSEILEQPAVQKAVASAVTDELITALDPGQRIADALPDQLKPAAAPIAASVRPALERTVTELLGSSRVQRVWSRLNTVTHEQGVRILRGEGPTVAGRTVVLDLRPLSQQIAEDAGLPPAVVTLLASGENRVQIVAEDEIEPLQQAVKTFEKLVVWLAILTLVLYLGAIALTPKGLRRGTVLNVGLAIVVVGVGALVVRRVVGGLVMDSATATESGEAVGEAVWPILTRMLVDAALASILVGLGMATAAWLAGPGRAGRWLRRTAGPHVRRAPALTVTAGLVLVLLIVAYAPVDALRRPVGLVLFLIGCFAFVAAMAAAAREEGVGYQPRAASPNE